MWEDIENNIIQTMEEGQLDEIELQLKLCYELNNTIKDKMDRSWKERISK
jgi:hypothetical protein